MVGAKGSGLQLVLSSVFHLDVPTRNVRFVDLRAIARHQMVEGVMPLSLGDAYRGFRIVGTTHACPNHYGANLAQGAVLGVAGVLLGAGLGHATAWLLAGWLERERSLSMGSLGWAPEEGLVMAGAVLIALAAAAVPAVRASYLEVTAVLAERR